MGCQLAKPKDINCKIFASGNSSICSECYSGFYWDAAKGLCTVVDQLCKTSDARSGACLSCWSGYSLSNSKCILQTVSNSSEPANNSNPNGVMKSIPDCEEVSASGECLRCR